MQKYLRCCELHAACLRCFADTTPKSPPTVEIALLPGAEPNVAKGANDATGSNDAKGTIELQARTAVPLSKELTSNLRVPAREQVGPVPAKTATGSFASVPRAHWPCAVRERWPNGDEGNITRFVYGRQKKCKLPVAYASDGIVGCVSHTVARFDGEFFDIMRVSYYDGKLSAADSNFGRTLYDWDQDVPVVAYELGWRRLPGRLELIFARQVVDVDVRGRPIHVWKEERNTLKSSGDFLWDGDRLKSIRWYFYEKRKQELSYVQELLYDCSALPRLRKSVNSGGALGISLKRLKGSD